MKEVIPFVVNHDEGREILDVDLPHRLHAKILKVEHFNLGDVIEGQNRGRAPDGAEIKPFMLRAGFCHLFAAVAFGEHDQAATLGLKVLDIGIHPPGSGRPKRAKVEVLDVVGIPLHLNLSSQLLMLSLFLPLCLLTSSVQILVSFLAKTFKEAMQYQQMVMMFPVIGAVLVFAFNDFHVEGTLTYVPILSQLQMGQSVLISGSYPTGLFALSVSIIVGLAAVVLIVASKRLGSEKILTAS